MSRDGRWFAGSAGLADGRTVALRWSAATGYQTFAPEPGWNWSYGLSISNTGRVGGSAEINTWYRLGRVWDEPGTVGRFAFPNLVSAMSDDRSVLTGWTRLGFLNVEINGQVHYIAGTNALGAGHDITGDGRWVAGFVQDGSPSGPHGPFRWSLATGLEMLPTLPGSAGSLAYAISGDGSTIAGFAGDGLSSGTFWTWTQAAGTVELPLPAGGILVQPSQIKAMDMNFDGSKLIVNYIGGSFNSGAIWLRDEGWVRARDYLLRFGVDIPPAHTIVLTRITDDGNRLLGYDHDGQVYRSWYVDVPAPASLAALAGLLAFARRRR